jgi:hypothetical protein
MSVITATLWLFTALRIKIDGYQFNRYS